MKKQLFLILAMSLPLFAQTAYVQTTKTCYLNACTNAQFTPSATLSYSLHATYFGQPVTGEVTWNGTEYADFHGEYNFLGYGNHYPYGEYELKGTFDNGAYTLTEDFFCFRSCGLHSNVSGSVVGP